MTLASHLKKFAESRLAEKACTKYPKQEALIEDPTFMRFSRHVYDAVKDCIVWIWCKWEELGAQYILSKNLADRRSSSRAFGRAQPWISTKNNVWVTAEQQASTAQHWIKIIALSLLPLYLGRSWKDQTWTLAEEEDEQKSEHSSFTI